MTSRILTLGYAALFALLLVGCSVAGQAQLNAASNQDTAERNAAFEQDRKAILAMTGDYEVRFDFQETVAFLPGYKLKDRKLSGGYESVRVLEDRGDFISLQHVLVASHGGQTFPIKHWRQDWTYEPASVLTYTGNNSWAKRPIAASNAQGKWSQSVYQVDDAPRYGAMAAWTHAHGVSSWAPPPAWRPLPRRDATTRDDYHVIDAVNRHVITPFGWVHEQDNTKLVIDGAPQLLAREVGINTYRRDSSYAVAVADEYLTKTDGFWAGVRAKWAQIEAENPQFGLTIEGEPAELYMPLLEMADAAANGDIPLDEALAKAEKMIDNYTTTQPVTLAGARAMP